MMPPTGRTTPEGTAAITVSITGGQDFRPEHPDPRHSTCPARNTHRGRRRHGAIPSCRTGTKPARHHLRRPQVVTAGRPRHPAPAEATDLEPRTPEPTSSTPARGHRRAHASSMTPAPCQHRARVIGARPARQEDQRRAGPLHAEDANHADLTRRAPPPRGRHIAGKQRR